MTAWSRALRRSHRDTGLAIAAVLLLASAAAGQQGNPCELQEPPSESRVAIGIGLRLAPVARMAPLAGEESPPIEPARLFSALQTEPSVEKVRTGSKKRFFSAAGEVVLLEVLPWAFDRYVLKEDFSYISFDTIKKNFQTGFKYDPDTFPVNQSSHPYHGSLFFNAARSNGYGYWESGLFALAGSLMWECCMENTPPSVNDLVNTTLGGMTRGEVSHRLASMLLDNTASGSNRVFREVGAAILSPMTAFNRLVRGEMTRDFENPVDRFPKLVVLAADLGYRNIGGGAAHPDQAVLTLSLLYGDPFQGDLARPFDSFWVGIDANLPGGVLFSRIEERGILKGWELGDPDASVRSIFGFSQEYEYFNNESQVFGAQMFGAGLLSRYQLGRHVLALTDASLIVIPLAGIKTTDFMNPQTGRNYDYAPGGGARVAGRIYLGSREILGAGYGVVWAHTANGVSDNNTLQFFRGVARFPLIGPVGAGAAYAWYSRKTTYTGFFEARKTQSEWRAFVNAAFAFP